MTTPFDPRSGLILVEARFVGPALSASALLAVDTGAIHTVIDRAFLETLGFAPDAAPTRRVMSASGFVRMPVVTVGSMTALGTARPDFPVLANTFPAARRWRGLLGLDFLRDRVLTIDFRAGTITLV